MLTNLTRFISFIFHPLFILFYLLIILLVVNPYLFSIQGGKDRIFLLVSIFIISVLFPLITIVMMRFVGFIESFEMKKNTERIGPLIATIVFYLWLFINIKRMNVVPDAFQLFVLGALIALFIAFFINNFSKISLHAIGMGGFVSALLLIRYKLSYHSFPINIFNQSFIMSVDLIVILGIIMAGAVCSSRLYLGAHSRQDIYGGFLLGLLGQIIALRFIDI